jgi:hypothetical protein
MITPADCRTHGLTEREAYIVLCLTGWFGAPISVDLVGAILAVSADRVELEAATAQAKMADQPAPEPSAWQYTTSATQLTWSVPMRVGPCWRCRYHLRWPPWRKHWACLPRIPMEFVEPL